MDSAQKELNLSNRILEFDNHFDEAVLIDGNGKRTLFSDLNKKLKYNIFYNKTDKSGKKSSAKQYMSKLRTLNNISINSISKKKLYKLNNHSNGSAFGRYKSLSESNISIHNQNGSNIKMQEMKNSEQDIKPSQNFMPCISKAIQGLMRILSKFKVQMNNLHIKHLGNKTLNQCDAKDMVFIIGCIISKLKEELCDQQKILTKSYLQQTLRYNSEQSCSYKSASPNKNTSRLKTKLSLREESLDNITEANNDMNYCVPVGIKSKKDKRYLSVGRNSTTTAVVEINNEIDSRNKQSLDAVFTKLREIDVIRTNIKRPSNILKNIHDNNLEITKTNCKHPTEIGNLQRWNSEETIIIPNNKRCTSSKQNLNVNNASSNSQIDEMTTMNESASSSSSVYMIPNFLHNVESIRFVKINPASIKKYGGIVDEKLFMVCKVELDELKSM